MLHGMPMARTSRVQDWIERVAHEPVDGRRGAPDVCVIEMGGTVGDIESMPFIEVPARHCFLYYIAHASVARAWQP